MNPENNKSQPRETTINFLHGDQTMTVFTSDQKWINRVGKLVKTHPEEAKITHINDDGSVMAELPVKYLKLSPPRKMSEENKAKATERLKAAKMKQLTLSDEFDSD